MISEWKYLNQEIKSIDDMKINEPKVWGFVYMLTLYNKQTGKLAYRYIGKKNIYSVTSKTATKTEMATMKKSEFKRTKMKNGTWKYYRTIVKESNWKDYISSNLFIKRNSGKYRIEREILLFSKNDNDLKYKEAKEIICQGALETEHFLNDGVSLRMFGKKIID
jgi:hypothetical protein